MVVNGTWEDKRERKAHISTRQTNWGIDVTDSTRGMLPPDEEVEQEAKTKHSPGIESGSLHTQDKQNTHMQVM